MLYVGLLIVRGTMKSRIQAIAFDAYGTLFDLHSVTALCNCEFPGQGAELSKLWRAKHLAAQHHGTIRRLLEGDKIGAGICLQQSEPRLPCRDPQRVGGIISAPR